MTYRDDTEFTTLADANPFRGAASSSELNSDEEIDADDVTMYPEVVYRPGLGATESLYGSDEDPTHSEDGDGKTSFLGACEGEL